MRRIASLRTGRLARPCIAALAVLLALVATRPAHAGGALPLPDAPVRLVIPDVAAFDAALGGSFREALTGTLGEDDPAYGAWKQTQVGAKLVAQWEKLSGNLPWTWDQIVALHARSLGLALLDAGHLETVLAIETPAAALPVALPRGKSKTHAGASYQLVAAGAGDSGTVGAGTGATSADGERRMGLAWARLGDVLLVATSERALIAALDEHAAGHGFAAPLDGLASVELDLDRLRTDRYFKREFAFAPGPETGRMRAALKRENGAFVEVREGSTEPRAPGYDIELPHAAASGWEADGSTLWSALRGGVLEPLPELSDRPHTALGVLPAANVESNDDRYLVSFLRPMAKPGTPATDEGELPEWKAFLTANPVSGWAFAVDADGTRKIGVPFPRTADDELLRLCQATAERRAGRVEVVTVGDAPEIRAGAGLPVVAIRRVGELVWIGPSAASLAEIPESRRSTDRIRWAKLDLGAVRAELPRWERAEGPAAPERVRLLSDRIAGLLGWIPDVANVSVERRVTSGGWTERVVFAPKTATR